MLLAKEGNREAVEFLIDKFKASRNAAVKGYALGGFVNLVNEQIKAGANPDYAVWGYANSGYTDQGKSLLGKDACFQNYI